MDILISAITSAILVLMPLWKSDAKKEKAQKYAEIIVEETQAVTPPMDPYLVTAIIFKESSFRAKIKGQKGEVGLMQVMPHAPMTPKSAKRHLTNARTNIRAGISHLQFWQQKCGPDDMELWVSAYNAGRCKKNKYGKRIRKLYCKIKPDDSFCTGNIS